MKHWFLPDVPDLLGLLEAQAAVTVAGVERFAEWSHGAVDAGEEVRSAEHAADDARRAVQTALRTAFSTPLDPEDLYELSERLDAVMNAVKDIVREAEVMAMSPDAHMAAMADALVAGTHQLARAVATIARDDDAATAASDEAVRACRVVERQYRAAMSELLASDDMREVMGKRELFRRFSRAADDVELVANRVWYAVVKAP